MLLEEYDTGPYETFDEDQANQYIHGGVIEFSDRVPISNPNNPAKFIKQCVI